MDDWIIILGFLVIILLLTPLINKDKKKPSKKEMAELKAKQKKFMKVMWWILGIVVIIIILFVFWVYSYDEQSVACSNACWNERSTCEAEMGIGQPRSEGYSYCKNKYDSCEGNC